VVLAVAAAALEAVVLPEAGSYYYMMALIQHNTIL